MCPCGGGVLAARLRLMEGHKTGERGTRKARMIAAVALLTLLVGPAGCGPPPTPLPPPPGGTPTAVVRLEPLRPNPLVLTRTRDLAAGLRPVVNGTYCTPAWSATTFPATLALPVEPVRGALLLAWNSGRTSDYISAPGAPTYGLPADYSISTSADSTDGRDGAWREVVRVTGNIARTRAHRFPFGGARWVRMTVTRVAPGPLGDLLTIDEIDLHDAANGTDDSVFFLGDSITAAAFARCPANQPSFAALVRRAAPGRFPAMIDGGVNGVNSNHGVAVIADWLALNPDFHIWAIGYGTNDAWQKVKPAAFEANLQTLVKRIQAADRVPIIARIPFAARGPADSDVQALNAVIDQVTAENGLLPGPDLYTWFRTHRDELSPDGVHPSEAGTRSINRLWYEALRPLYDAGP